MKWLKRVSSKVLVRRMLLVAAVRFGKATAGRWGGKERSAEATGAKVLGCSIQSACRSRGDSEARPTTARAESTDVRESALGGGEGRGVGRGRAQARPIHRRHRHHYRVLTFVDLFPKPQYVVLDTRDRVLAIVATHLGHGLET